MNRKGLWALTLVGHPRDNSEPDPLAVLHLDNRLYIYIYIEWERERERERERESLFSKVGISRVDF